MKKFKDKNILLIGDLMLDTYLYGDVDRVSPESPVPVVDIKKTENKLGGASNVALNIKKLGSNPIICSVIGDDDNSKIMKQLLLDNNIKIDNIICSKDRKTTNKTRVIGNGYQIVRFDDEITDVLNHYDYTNLIRRIELIIEKQQIDVILLQDYDKGVIDRNLINDIIKLADNDIPIVVDPKKRNFNHYKNIKLIKPNFKELMDGLNIDIESDMDRDEILKLGSNKLHKKGIEIVVITLSGDGIFFSYNNGKNFKILNGLKRNVSDVSGAGDTVISIISTLLTSNIDIKDMIEISNIAGGIVCEYKGVVPIDIEKLNVELKINHFI